MKRLMLLFVVMGTLSAMEVKGSPSAISFQTEKNSTMQVYVNGKLYNTAAKSFVRVKSNPGLYRIELKVLNPHDKVWYLVRKDVQTEKGYEFQYKVIFPKGKRPSLELIRRYPVFNNYFNPSAAYKNPVA